MLLIGLQLEDKMSVIYFSKNKNGFYSSEIHGENIPSDAVEITDEQHAALLQGQTDGQEIAGDGSGFPILVDRVQVAVVPRIVTMRQARLALLADGKLAAVETAINALPEPQRSAARIEWDYSSEVHRDRAFVQTLGAALGLDSDALDALFTQAATL